MLAVTAAAFAKSPSKASNQTRSNASTALGASGGAMQARPTPSGAEALQQRLSTRPRVRESARPSSASGLNATHRAEAGGIKNNGTKLADFLKTNVTERKSVSVRTETAKEEKEKCGARKTANALIEVGGLSKESNKTREREVLKKFSSCFTQPYRQSEVTKYPETYQACQELGLGAYFGFILKSGKPYYEKSKEFDELSSSTNYTQTSAFLKDNFPEIWGKAEQLISDRKISRNTAACLAFSAYVNAKAENMTLINGQDALIKINTENCDSSVMSNERLKCIKDARESVIKYLFGDANKTVESSSGTHRNGYSGPVYELNTTKYLFAIFNGQATDKLFDLANKGNVTEIISDGNFLSRHICTYPEFDFNEGGTSAPSTAANLFWNRYSDVLLQALELVENKTLDHEAKEKLVDAMGKDNGISAFDSSYDYDDDGDDAIQSQSLSAPQTASAKREAFNATKTRLSNAVEMTKAKEAWAMRDHAGRPLTGHGSHVAILDTGTDKGSPFLQGANIETLCISRDDGEHKTHCVGHRTLLHLGTQEPNAYSCFGEEENYLCDHGTATASAIVGRFGPKDYGIAPNASILALNNLESKLSTSEAMQFTSSSPVFYMQVLESLLKETAHKNISALSMSFSFPNKYGGAEASDFPVLQAMFDALRSKGVVSVGASGNDKEQQGAFPNFIDGVVSVGACRHLEDGSIKKASYSGFGPEVDIYALSKIRVASTTQQDASGIDGVSKRSTGTSFSTPLVSGALAILRQQAGDQIPQDRLADAMTWALYHRPNESDWHRVDGTNLRPVLDIKVACQNMQQVLNGTFSVDELPGSDENGEVKSFKDFLPRWQAWRQKNPPSSRDSVHTAGGQQASGFGTGAAAGLAALGLALGAAGLGCAALSHKNRRKERQAKQHQEAQPLTNQAGKARTSTSATPLVEMETVV